MNSSAELGGSSMPADQVVHSVDSSPLLERPHPLGPFVHATSSSSNDGWDNTDGPVSAANHVSQQQQPFLQSHSAHYTGPRFGTTAAASTSDYNSECGEVALDEQGLGDTLALQRLLDWTVAQDQESGETSQPVATTETIDLTEKEDLESPRVDGGLCQKRKAVGVLAASPKRSNHGSPVVHNQQHVWNGPTASFGPSFAGGGAGPFAKYSTGVPLLPIPTTSHHHCSPPSHYPNHTHHQPHHHHSQHVVAPPLRPCIPLQPPMIPPPQPSHPFITHPLQVPQHSTTYTSNPSSSSQDSEIFIVDDDDPSEIVDLTDIDPAEEAKLKQKAVVASPQRIKPEIVCFGLINTLVQPLNYDVYKNYCGQEKHLNVRIVPEPSITGASSLVKRASMFHVVTADGSKLGKLKEDVALAFAPFFRHIIIEAAIPRYQHNKYTAPIKLIVFGTQQVGSTLGNVLLKLNIQLEEVSRLNGVQVRYWNPQYENGGVAQQQYLGSPSAWRTSTCERVTTTTATVEDVKNQIDAVYQSLTAAEDLPEAEPDPRLITPLYKHQKQALHFMIEKERIVNYADPAEKLRSLWTCENGKYRNSVTSETVSSEPPQALGGILADDMGLGKTIEMISLVLANQPNEEVVKESSGVVVEAPSSDPDPYFFLPGRQATTSVAAGSPPPAGGEVPSRATLIVCPLSTVANWEEQFASHVLEGSLKLYVYHGINRIQDPEKLASYDVVLTTYNVLSLEYGRLQKAQQQPPEQRRPCTSALQSVYWLRVVLDEAHVIKERNTHQAKAAGALHAQRRWCLTGTPIHNKVDDLYSLLRFLGLVPFNHWKTFSHYIMKPLKNRSEVAVSRLQTVMKLITLRRTKDQKIDGRPILSLPPKTTSVYKLTLEATEQALYDRVFERARTVFRELDSSGKVFKHYATLLELLLRLRQVVTHPALYRDQGGLSDPIRDLEQGEDHPLLTAQRAAHIMSLLRDAGHDKCSLCSTMVDGNGDRVPVVSRCGHLFCDECTRDVLDGNSTLNCFLCSSVLTKGDILEIKDIDAAQDMDDALLSTHHAVPNEPSTPSLSTKVRTLLDDLLRVQRETRQNNQPPIKSIVFSQWTHMLDLIQPALTSCRIGYCRLDGKMSRHERTLAMDRLKFDPTVTVMLVSLKAGGVGLNLTSASRVYILEPYWNPAVEDQAQDRVHRMGQTRPVHVIRFVVEDSIEEVIESMKRRKRELVATAFKTEGKSEVEVDGSGSQGGNRGRGVKEKAELQQRKLNDLRALFGFKDS